MEAEQWWKGWWEADFSWEGLAQKTQYGRTLQDYWRAEESQLIKGPDGRLWTRFHLPFHWPNGAPTGKESWDRSALDAFSKTLAEKIANAAEDGFTACFDGIVTPSGVHWSAFAIAQDPDAKLVSASARYAWLDDFRSGRRIGTADFSNAYFSGDADFGEATFSDYAYFRAAAFSGDAYFGSATFSGLAYFGSAAFSGYTYFSSATFSGDAEFWGATLRRR